MFLVVEAVLIQYHDWLVKRVRPKSATVFRDQARRFLAYLRKKHVPLEEVTQEIADGFPTWCQAGGAKSITVIAYTSGLNRFLRWASGQELIRMLTFKPVPRPPAERHIVRVLTQEQLWQFLRLVGAYEEPYRTIIVVLASTGMRISEVVSLTLNSWHVTSEGVVVFNVKGKGGKERFVPMFPRVNPIFKRYLRDYRSACKVSARTADCLWIGQSGQGVRARSIEYHFRRLRGAVGIPWLAPHRLRATFLTFLNDNKVDPFTIKEIAGHASLATTALYIGVPESRLVDAVAKAGQTIQGG